MNQTTSETEKRVTVNIPANIHSLAMNEADRRNISISAYYRHAVESNIKGIPNHSHEIIMLRAHMSELTETISQINATASSNKISREELIEALTIIARLKPEFEYETEKLRKSFEKCRGETAAAGSLLNDEVASCQRQIESVTRASGQATRALNDLLLQTGKAGRNFSETTDKLKQFQNNLELEYRQACERLNGFLMQYFLYGISLVLLGVLTVYGVHRLLNYFG